MTRRERLSYLEGRHREAVNYRERVGALKADPITVPLYQRACAVERSWEALVAVARGWVIREALSA